MSAWPLGLLGEQPGRWAGMAPRAAETRLDHALRPNEVRALGLVEETGGHRPKVRQRSSKVPELL